jgi:RND family efflux transporter MFP subunit
MAKRLLLVLPLLLAACGRTPPAPPVAAPPTPVQVAPVALSARAIPVRVPGVVSRRAESALAFKAGGIVRTVSVRAGDQVEAGQVLASLDLAESDAQLAQARSGVEKARRDRDRALELKERDVVSTELAQNAATGLEQAEAALRIAEFNRRHAVVAAPAAGHVLKRLVEPNDAVAVNKVAILFASEDEGWIARAGVPEADAARLQLGDTATIAAPGGPALAGELAQLSEATDPQTRTTEVEVRLAAAPAGLRSGSVVDLELQPRDVPARPVVPVTALVEGDGRAAHVFLVAPDGRTVQRRKVTVQTVHDGQAFLAGELPAGASVVVTGAEFLREGAAVEIVP